MISWNFFLLAPSFLSDSAINDIETVCYSYRKFLRSKDLSVQKEEDLECVMGTKKRKLQALASEQVPVCL